MTSVPHAVAGDVRPLGLAFHCPAEPPGNGSLCAIALRFVAPSTAFHFDQIYEFTT
jgi:hypothetical protein